MKNKKIMLGAIIGVIFLLAIGVTYAYFSATLNVEGGSNDVVTTTGTLELTYTDGPQINANNISPGWTTTKTVTVRNTGTLDTYYSLNWYELTNTIEQNELVMSATCVASTGNCNAITSSPVATTAGIIRENISIAAGVTHTYTITLTFKEMSSVQNYNQGKRFSGMLRINESEPLPTLTQKMLIDNTAQSDASINFTAISSSTNGQGLYYTSDLDKTEGGERVYYYRGAVTNNYVQFAGFCWKIVRTNEDGSVKLMYWGPTNGGSCSATASMPSSLYGKKYNASYNDNRYVGYMYGSSCSDYASCHTNTTNSNIKGLIDTWYNTNIESQYRSKIANAKYCNDRTLYSGSGSGTTTSYYGPSGRLSQGSSFAATNASPQYDCPNDARDAFTLKVASGGTAGYGNNKLDYPVGLLTADEISYAGGVYGSGNNTYFLYTGSHYWTMSPFYFVGSDSFEWSVSSGGRLNDGYVGDTYLGAFPAISLNSSALVSSGQGTVTEPYIIQ